MAMRYGYFDSEITGVDDEGMPIFDRAESSEFMAKFISSIISDGILASPGDCFQVVASSGMTLIVRPGFGLIKGRFAYDEMDYEITLSTAPRSYKRIDRVVLRCNYLERLCEIVVKEGEPANSPVAPELIRPAAGDYYEMCLATITINPNQTVITQSSIQDNRYDSNYCGIITQVIDHIDTSTFYDQFNAFYEEFVEKSNTTYAAWLKQFQERYNLFNQMAQNAYDAYAVDLDEYISKIESYALKKYTETSDNMDAYYDRITQEGQELYENYYNRMTSLADTFETDAQKQYDKTFEILTGMANRARAVYNQFSQDVIDFYNDIAERGETRYQEFDDQITQYIEELESRGDTELAEITSAMATFCATNREEFLEWFEEIKGKLGEDEAGKLELEIEEQTDRINFILEMLYEGVVMAPIITDDGYQIVDDTGVPISQDWKICNCNTTT